MPKPCIRKHNDATVLMQSFCCHGSSSGEGNLQHLTQGESLIVRNFVNAHLRHLLCIYSLSVNHDSTNLFINIVV